MVKVQELKLCAVEIQPRYLLPYTRVNKRNSLLSAYFFLGFAPG